VRDRALSDPFETGIMLAVVFTVSLYSGLASFLLVLHALFILWVVFGGFLAWSRPVLRWLHIASLVWGILTEVLYWPCPLTFAENALEQRGGIQPYRGGFLLHYLDKLIYPDISPSVLTIATLIVCALNLCFYAWRLWVAHRIRSLLKNATPHD
jgi:Protein of Unknown function (DUF2784)